MASKSKLKVEDLRKEVRGKMIDVYGSMYSAFEEAVINESGFKEEWSGKWVSHFIKIAADNVTPPFVTIGGFLDLTRHHN